MLRRLLRFLPQHPPDWLIGFWTLYGLLLILSIFLQGLPTQLGDQIFFFARLVVGLLCWAIAAALVWRRAQKP